MKAPKKPTRNPPTNAIDFVRDKRQPLKERVRTALSLMRTDPELARPFLLEFLEMNIGPRLRSRIINSLGRRPGRGVSQADRDFQSYCGELRDGGPARRRLFITLYLPGVVPIAVEPHPLAYIGRVVEWVKANYAPEWEAIGKEWENRVSPPKGSLQ